jgi:hypothetical protein
LPPRPEEAPERPGAHPDAHGHRGGTARIIRAGTKEDGLARQLLDGKYQGWREGKRLSSWARNALPVAIEIA